MIGYIIALLLIALGLVILIAVGCAVVIVGYIFYQSTIHICEDIKKGMDNR